MYGASPSFLGPDANTIKDRLEYPSCNAVTPRFSAFLFGRYLRLNASSAPPTLQGYVYMLCKHYIPLASFTNLSLYPCSSSSKALPTGEIRLINSFIFLTVWHQVVTQVYKWLSICQSHSFRWLIFFGLSVNRITTISPSTLTARLITTYSPV